MKPLKITVTLFIMLLIISGLASQAFADISNAALLYLRIAPGARAAGMGEAYVAIADDATSTHWNPAGLGATPLADSWESTKIPEEFQPITSMISVKARSGNDYLAYDIWAISIKGLIRYDNKSWFSYEVFNTKTDQTVKSIASSYFNITDEEKLSIVSEKIAVDNNEKDYEWLKNFTDSVLAAVPSDYDRIDELTLGVDSLLLGYYNCLVNWNRIKDAEKSFNDAMKDSTLSKSEVEKINFAIEKSKNRFIPEELKIYYSTIFDSQPELMAASENILLVSSENSVFAYNGKRWKVLTSEDGELSGNVLSMKGIANNLFIGTYKGIVKYNGLKITPVGQIGELPEGPVTAIGATSAVDIWIVLNNKLYHYDGTSWTNSHSYTTTIDDTPAKIAEKFALYKTDKEKNEYISLMKELNSPAVVETAQTSTDSTDTDTTTAVVAETAVIQPLEPLKSLEPIKSIEITSDDQVFEPGTVIEIPYIAGIKGEVTSILVGFNSKIWIGTSYGAISFKENEWMLHGYEIHTVEDGLTFDSLMTINNQQSYSDNAYSNLLMDINDLDSENLEAGQVVKIYKNPSASPIKNISSRSDHVYFASDNGVFEYYEDEWSRMDISNLGSSNVIKAYAFDNKLWFASSDRVVTKADGRTDISMMVAKWLPQLADDMYYGFFSVVRSYDGLGTLGGSITFISYGTINRRDATGADLGNFDSFDITFASSYGTSLTKKMKFGLSAKLIYSYLTEQGTALEKGKGTATGFALDFGFLYQMNSRLNLGLAVTNLGPDISYIDAAQSDPLPRNLALGFSYKLINRDYYHLLFTTEVNKSLVGVDDGFGEEFKQLVINGGGEFMYANIFAIRAGYIYDEEGDIKTITLGFGLRPLTNFKFDFAYIPSGTEAPLANTLRISLQILP